MSDFFVYIVESPSAPDLYHRRSEGQILLETLRLHEMPCVARCAISKIAFDAAFRVGLKDELKNFPDKLPIVHISCHGDGNGIQLSNGEFIPWDNLAALLEPINTAINNRLVVAMSCCEGYAGTRMSMTTNQCPLPYFCLVGTSDKPTWSDTCVAFTTFYHRLNKGVHIADAVAAMRSASGIKNFFVEWAESSRKSYVDYCTKHYNANSTVQLLSDAANAQPKTAIEQQSLLEKGKTDFS